MKVKVSLYVISVVLAIIGFPTVLVLLYLDFVADIPSKFFWAASVSCCVFSILSFSLARIMADWEDEDEDKRK